MCQKCNHTGFINTGLDGLIYCDCSLSEDAKTKLDLTISTRKQMIMALACMYLEVNSSVADDIKSQIMDYVTLLETQILILRGRIK